MPVSAPLDKIPALPAQAVSGIQQIVNRQIESISRALVDSLERTIQLPDAASCDDPKVQGALEALRELQQRINQMQQIVSKIQTIATTIKTLIGTAQAIKTAQLLNPITGPAAIAAELVIVQNMTIANATIAVKELVNIPNAIQAALTPVQESIGSMIPILSSKCNNAQFELDTTAANSAGILGNNEIDLSSLDDAIKQQQELLTSLEEAPSKVYRNLGEPVLTLGKPGDYYIDERNKLIYGPKPSRDSWGSGIKY